MATGDRTKRIRQRVQDLAGDPRGVSIARDERVYRLIDEIQTRLAEQAYALEAKISIRLHPGRTEYAAPSDMLVERRLIPQSQSTELVRVNFLELDKIKREYNALINSDQTDLTSGDIFYYYHWQGKFGFLRADGGTPSNSATIDLYYWRTPGTADAVSESKDPVLDRRWDTAIVYGVAAEIVRDPYFTAMFDKESERVRQKEQERERFTADITPEDSYE